MSRSSAARTDAPSASPWRNGRRVRPAVGVVLAALIACPVQAVAATTLWKKLDHDCPRDALSRQAKRCVPVKINDAAIGEPAVAGEVLTLDLPSDRFAQVSANPSKDPPVSAHKGVLIWHGTVDQWPWSTVTFVKINQTVVGTIEIDGVLFRLRSVHNESVIELLNRDQIPDDAAEPHTGRDAAPPPLPPPPLPSAPTGLAVRPYCYDTDEEAACLKEPPACDSDDPYRIDVMVLYTKAAYVAVGDSDDAINAWIYLNEYMTNLSYTQSYADLQIRVVHVAQVPYVEKSSTVDDLTSLTQQCDTGEDSTTVNSAHCLREQFNADVVVLVTDRASGAGSTEDHVGGDSGMARTMQYFNVVGPNLYSSWEPCAFAVVNTNGFLTPTYTFAHELGHVMGAQHQQPPSNEGAIVGASHGHLGTASDQSCPEWGTIMAQRDSCCSAGSTNDCSCNRVLYWSADDSRVKYCGQVTGGPSENNRETLDLTRATVSQFRCGSPPPANVWMKDAWSDTGAEPDPGLAGQPMWKSPYIWVRNAQDSAPFPNQHKHENPVSGQANYVYVKMHNGNEGPAPEQGTLEVWACNSATSFSWQTDFRKIAGVDEQLAPRSTKIVEVPWTPTRTSEGCLLARWVSNSDPMTTPETADVVANTRGNNNIVWRNVNVVDLGSAASATATMTVRNSRLGPARITLTVRPSARGPRSFFTFGRATVQLDTGLMASWRRGGYEGTGRYRRLGRSVEIFDPEGAALQNLMLPPRAEGRVTILFQRTRTADIPIGTFDVDVVQLQDDSGGLRVAGGLTYEIRMSDHSRGL